MRITSKTSLTEEEKREVVEARMEMEHCIENTPGIKSRPKELPDVKERIVSLAALVALVSESVGVNSQAQSQAQNEQILEVRVKRCRDNLLQPESLSYRLGGEYAFLDVLYVISALNKPKKKGNYVHVYAEDISTPWMESASGFRGDYQKSNRLIQQFKQPNKPLEIYLVGKPGTFIIVVTDDGKPHLVSGKPKLRSKAPDLVFTGRRPLLQGTYDALTWKSLEKNGPLRPYQVYSLISPFPVVSITKSASPIHQPNLPVTNSPTAVIPTSATSCSPTSPAMDSLQVRTPDTDTLIQTHTVPEIVLPPVSAPKLDFKPPSPPPSTTEPPVVPPQTSMVPPPSPTPPPLAPLTIPPQAPNASPTSEGKPPFHHDLRVQFAIGLFICVLSWWFAVK